MSKGSGSSQSAFGNKPKFTSKNLNALTKAPVQRATDTRYGNGRLFVLGKTGNRSVAVSKGGGVSVPTPINTPSLRKENKGQDINVSLVPSGGSGWGGRVSDGNNQQLSGSPPEGSFTKSNLPPSSNDPSPWSKPSPWATGPVTSKQASKEDENSDHIVSHPTDSVSEKKIRSLSTGRWGDDAVEDDFVSFESHRLPENEYPELSDSSSYDNSSKQEYIFRSNFSSNDAYSCDRQSLGLNDKRLNSGHSRQENTPTSSNLWRNKDLHEEQSMDRRGEYRINERNYYGRKDSRGQPNSKDYYQSTEEAHQGFMGSSYSHQPASHQPYYTQQRAYSRGGNKRIWREEGPHYERPYRGQSLPFYGYGYGREDRGKLDDEELDDSGNLHQHQNEADMNSESRNPRCMEVKKIFSANEFSSLNSNKEDSSGIEINKPLDDEKDSESNKVDRTSENVSDVDIDSQAEYMKRLAIARAGARRKEEEKRLEEQRRRSKERLDELERRSFNRDSSDRSNEVHNNGDQIEGAREECIGREQVVFEGYHLDNDLEEDLSDGRITCSRSAPKMLFDPKSGSMVEASSLKMDARSKHGMKKHESKKGMNSSRSKNEENSPTIVLKRPVDEHVKLGNLDDSSRSRKGIRLDEKTERCKQKENKSRLKERREVKGRNTHKSEIHQRTKDSDKSNSTKDHKLKDSDVKPRKEHIKKSGFDDASRKITTTNSVKTEYRVDSGAVNQEVPPPLTSGFVLLTEAQEGIEVSMDDSAFEEVKSRRTLLQEKKEKREKDNREAKAKARQTSRVNKLKYSSDAKGRSFSASPLRATGHMKQTTESPTRKSREEFDSSNYNICKEKARPLSAPSGNAGQLSKSLDFINKPPEISPSRCSTNSEFRSAKNEDNHGIPLSAESVVPSYNLVKSNTRESESSRGSNCGHAHEHAHTLQNFHPVFTVPSSQAQTLLMPSAVLDSNGLMVPSSCPSTRVESWKYQVSPTTTAPENPAEKQWNHHVEIVCSSQDNALFHGNNLAATEHLKSRNVSSIEHHSIHPPPTKICIPSSQDILSIPNSRKQQKEFEEKENRDKVHKRVNTNLVDKKSKRKDKQSSEKNRKKKSPRGQESIKNEDLRGGEKRKPKSKRNQNSTSHSSGGSIVSAKPSFFEVEKESSSKPSRKKESTSMVRNVESEKSKKRGSDTVAFQSKEYVRKNPTSSIEKDKEGKAKTSNRSSRRPKKSGINVESDRLQSKEGINNATTNSASSRPRSKKQVYVAKSKAS